MESRRINRLCRSENFIGGRIIIFEQQAEILGTATTVQPLASLFCSDFFNHPHRIRDMVTRIWAPSSTMQIPFDLKRNRYAKICVSLLFSCTLLVWILPEILTRLARFHPFWTLAMKAPILVLLITQCCLTATAVVFNSILLLIIWSSKKTKMGNYKYIMNAFTIFEALFAVVCLIGMPMHSISDRTWIEFTSYGVLANTKFAKLGPILYCMMYEIWLGFIILHFMYRYVVLCKPQWVMAIKLNYWLQIILILVIIFYIVVCLICSLYLCPYDEPSTKVLDEIKEFFDIEANKTIGYYVIRLTTLEGAFSIVGLLALLVHYMGVFGSAIVVAFCSWRIWKTIRKMQAAQQHVNVALERQLFIALLLQTVVPVFLTHLPSMFVLTFPLWEDNVTIGPMSSMFPLFLTITKVVDPIVPLICIRDYRRKFMQFIRCSKYDPVETGAQPTKTVSLQRSMSTKSAPAKDHSYDEICRLIASEGAYELTLFGELITNL